MLDASFEIDEYDSDDTAIMFDLATPILSHYLALNRLGRSDFDGLVDQDT